MRKMLSNAIVTILMLAILSSCGAAPAGDDTDQTSGGEQVSSGIITEMSDGTVEQHVDIQELPAVEGEALTNPYYKRELNDEGTVVYTVLPVGAEETESFPASGTVIYSSEFSDCYYEVVTYTYKLNGEPVEMTQYQLHVKS